MNKPFEPGSEIVSKTERNNRVYIVTDCTGNMVSFYDPADKTQTYWRNVNTMELKETASR